MILKKANINPTLLTNLVFSFFPISFIMGNLIINLNILLFCCLGIFHLKSRILTTKYDFSIKIIFLFFFIIFFSTSLSFIKFLYIDGYEFYNLTRLIKSIIFFRFFLMLVITYFLSELGILNFKYFFISAALFPILISFDIIYQFFFGFNIIGLEGFSTHMIPAGKYNSSFFGDELIAGGYIKNFSFFAIFFLIFKLENKNNIKFILTSVAICILGLGILLSGNRMPFVLYILGLFIIFFFSNNLKKLITVSFLSLTIIFYLVLSFDETRYVSYNSFYVYAKNNLTTLYNHLTSDPKSNKSKIEVKEESEVPVGDFDSFWQRRHFITSGQKEIFLTALDIWGKNKIFGNGIKSFRMDCGKLQEYTKNRLCSNHPHNYYLEILTETGVVGFFITAVIGLLFIVFILKNFKSLRGSNKENLFLLASTISLFVEAFPIKSTGSIFSTYNAAYFTLIAAIFLSFKKLRKI